MDAQCNRRGLSPRLRGNRHCHRRPYLGHRSIPALAGEPESASTGIDAIGVYPRACGGTQPYPIAVGTGRGLSPRLRGNLAVEHRVGDLMGSIPALAGEPRSRDPRNSGPAVYPRACGGTFRISDSLQGSGGLSPRLRGNRHCHRRPYLGHRSIPALAGEPSRASRLKGILKVYPRACGGTSFTLVVADLAGGLSPRLRGNRSGIGSLHPLLGSIPALAGEPQVWVQAPPPPRVYPRACGGTTDRATVITKLEGLSPRLRGNPPCAP